MTKTVIPNMVDLLEAGVQFGHDRSKKNPKMEPFFWLQRDRIAIIDLEKTVSHLESALKALENIVKKTPNAEILFVGTKRQAREIVRRQAEEIGMPYVTRRWLGGTFTNFDTILKSIEKLDELKKKLESDDATKLSKKERMVMQKEVDRLEEVLEGIKNMRKLPAALVVIGSHDEKLAVREARRMKIPVIGITDTNADPSLVDFPIPANDDAVRAIEIIVTALTTTIKNAK